MKQKNYLLGGWVDESVPREEIRILVQPLNIDADEFCEWLAVQVGRYRSWTEMREQTPTRNEQIAVLRDYQKTLAKTISFLTPGGLPPHAEAEMVGEWWNFTKSSLHDLEHTAADTLRKLMVTAEIVERKLGAQKQQRGQKADPRKAELLANVSNWLSQKGVAPARARATTARVMTLCGVEGVPDTKTTLRRAARRGTQLQGN
ncbi:hypothetical protein SAMN05428957_103275 [Oryzisolibacter propanilivorax]|uniref:Uncharacterized protein n=1 Tax=Oryzisolibacter propanilivorax TaxID=1527607 RepID=A0A1G9RGY1_9BURK|nr:hypothetical protein [Oryzisolibacter propanilivorax]SDM22582.1 hypothetical protein SAMN05428957_103275 [Oryzisolibacter propanilivorax]